MIINDVNTMLMMETSPLPQGYTLLNWLQSDGAPYINLGKKINSPTTFRIKFKYISGSISSSSRSGVWGANTGVSAGFGLSLFSYQTNNYFAVFSNGTNGTGINAADIIGGDIDWYFKDNENAYHLDINNGFITRDYTSTNIKWWASTTNAYLFRTSYNAPGTEFRVYSFKCGTNLDLVPAKRNSDSVVGMYNLAEDTFLTGSGNGSFTYG